MERNFRKLVSPTLKDLFVEQLERMILDGELAPGDRLPPEREMAQQTGVSLAVAHAGITHLASLGFLRVVPRQGVFVADYVRDGDVNTLKEIMSFTGTPLGKDVMEPISRLRRGVETRAIRLACENRTSEDLERLQAIVDEMGGADVERLGELGFEFHHGIGLATRSMYYPMMIRTFKPFYVIFTQGYARQADAEGLMLAMRRQLEAVRRRDADEGARLVAEHVDSWTRFYLSNNHAPESSADSFRFAGADGTAREGKEDRDGRKTGVG